MKLLWQQISSPIITKILTSNTTLDGVVLDCEHGFFNKENLLNCINAKAKGKLVIVRLPEVSKSMISYCLDAGADGLIFANIVSRKQSIKILEYSLFPPLGKRGLGFSAHNDWGEKKKLGVHKKPLLIPQIESSEAVEKIKEEDQTTLILNSSLCDPAFDYYLIGPYDLSLSLGSAGDYDSKEFKSAMKVLKQKIGEKKLGIHIPKNVKSNISKFKNYGLKCLGMDTTSLIKYSQNPEV
ncbi:aldolase/citrate lyase family protein [Verrucomicrobia bacterium]|nr:aldolase/citrate lyase family protein [Verrucomicrobiota bacterium]